jgi:hypothetical protein
MSDLKLLDELLHDLKYACNYKTWAEVHYHSSITIKIMKRLKEAYFKTNEMNIITLGLANYLRNLDI